MAIGEKKIKTYLQYTRLCNAWTIANENVLKKYI